MGLLLVGLCGRAGAVEIVVSTAVHGSEPTPREGMLRANPVAGFAAEADQPPAVQTAIPIPGAARLKLAAGIAWRLAITAEGYWSPSESALLGHPA